MDKKKYEKPAVIYREKIEAKAGTCTPGKASSVSCGSGPYVS